MESGAGCALEEFTQFVDVGLTAVADDHIYRHPAIVHVSMLKASWRAETTQRNAVPLFLIDENRQVRISTSNNNCAAGLMFEIGDPCTI